MNPDKYKIPLPLLIMHLIIIFFIVLIISSWYFQSKLQQINDFSKNEITTKIISGTITIGTDAELSLENYFTDLTGHISNEIGAKADLKIIAANKIFNALDKKQVDFIISATPVTDEKNQKYIFSNTLIYINNNSYKIIVRKEDKVLFNKLNNAFNSLLVKGTITDLKQQWLERDN